MHHTIELASGFQMIVGTLSGEATLEGFRTYATALISPPFDSLKCPVVTDMRALDMHALQPQDIEQIVAFVDEAGDKVLPVKHAIVVSEGLSYGFARMFQMLSKGLHSPHVRVFSSDIEARKWLGVG